MSQAKSMSGRSNAKTDVGKPTHERRKGIVFAHSANSEEGLIAAQLKLCREYATSRGIEVMREFTSVGESNREQLGTMLEFLKKNSECRVLVVEQSDRLCRNLEDYFAIEGVLEQLGAELHLVKGAQVVKSQAKSQDKLLRGLFDLQSNYYRDCLREEILKGQKARAEQGFRPGGRAPFGYKHNRESGTVEVDPKSGPLVTRMFTLYGSGTPAIPSLQRVMRGNGRIISASQLRNILRSRFYLGFFTWAGIEYQGVHKPLVDSRTFKRVQRLLTRPGTKGGRHARSAPPNAAD